MYHTSNDRSNFIDRHKQKTCLSLDSLIGDFAAGDADADGVAALAGRLVGGRSAGGRVLPPHRVLQSLGERSSALRGVELGAVSPGQLLFLIFVL